MTADGPRVVFVASLGHSGSTLLELLLGAGEDVLALGEVRSLFTRLDADPEGLASEPCSCGRSVAACPFWSPLLPELAARPGEVDRYARVLRRVAADAERSGRRPPVVVDSSKNLAALRSLRATGVEVAVVHLVRDVRSWTVAYRERSRRKGELAWGDLVRRHGARGAGRRLRRTGLASFRLWYRRNREIDAALAGSGVPVVTVGYEPLALDPERVVSSLCDRLGLTFDAAMLRPDPRGNHSVLGNRMAHDPSAPRRVAYDVRWLTRRDWQVPELLSPDVMAYNARTVHGA